MIKKCITRRIGELESEIMDTLDEMRLYPVESLGYARLGLWVEWLRFKVNFLGSLV